MGKVNLSDDSTGVPGSDRHGGRGPFANAIGGEDDGFFEGRRVEGTRRVAVVVFGEPEPGADVDLFVEHRQ